jgi:predicted AAA+ superfamily ATPase
MKNLLNRLFEISNNKINNTKYSYNRFLVDLLLHNKSRFSGIFGSRGVGKTTVMIQFAKELGYGSDEILYISCDHPLISNISIFDLVDEFYKYGGKCILIDEIHEANNFEQELKSIYDFFDIKVLFSGSSAIKLTNPSFVRRYSMFHLPILSFKEYLELTLGISLESYEFKDILQNHTNISNEIIRNLKDERILKHFSNYLKVGAYPFYFENSERFNQMLLDTVDTVLYKDLSSIYNLSGEKIVALKKLLVSICVSEPVELSMEKLTKKVGISKVTLYKYIEYLHKAELLRHIVYEAKRFKNLQKPDKLYLSNPVLFNSLCIEPKIGAIRESFFASQLSFEHTVYYHSKADFLVDEKYLFVLTLLRDSASLHEIGGKNKSFNQIKDLDNSFVVADDIEVGFANKIPLWLFGFLY